MDEKKTWEPLTESEPIHFIIDKHKKNERITKSKRQRKRSNTMNVTPTSELVCKLRLVADKTTDRTTKTVLKAAAERLVDQEKIAEHYRIKAEEVQTK